MQLFLLQILGIVALCDYAFAVKGLRRKSIGSRNRAGGSVAPPQNIQSKGLEGSPLNDLPDHVKQLIIQHPKLAIKDRLNLKLVNKEFKELDNLHPVSDMYNRFGVDPKNPHSVYNGLLQCAKLSTTDCFRQVFDTAKGFRLASLNNYQKQALAYMAIHANRMDVLETLKIRENEILRQRCTVYAAFIQRPLFFSYFQPQLTPEFATRIQDFYQKQLRFSGEMEYPTMEQVKTLLSQGVDVNMVNLEETEAEASMLETHLSNEVAKENRNDLLKLMLDHGADMFPRGRGVNAFDRSVLSTFSCIFDHAGQSKLNLKSTVIFIEKFVPQVKSFFSQKRIPLTTVLSHKIEAQGGFTVKLDVFYGKTTINQAFKYHIVSPSGNSDISKGTLVEQKLAGKLSEDTQIMLQLHLKSLELLIEYGYKLRDFRSLRVKLTFAPKPASNKEWLWKIECFIGIPHRA